MFVIKNKNLYWAQPKLKTPWLTDILSDRFNAFPWTTFVERSTLYETREEAENIIKNWSKTNKEGDVAILRGVYGKDSIVAELSTEIIDTLRNMLKEG